MTSESSSEQVEASAPLEKRPGILFIGSPTVGKTTPLSRLLGLYFDDDPDSSPEQLAVHGWSINTKYYTADVAVWMARLDERFSIEKLPMYDQLSALIMVFDTTELSSLVALQNWVSRNDITKFDILLCIGNKVDLVRGHPVHVEYRRRLLKVGESFCDSRSDFTEYGISETEGRRNRDGRRLGNHISDGAWRITLSTLRLVVRMLSLTSVRS